MALSIPPNLLDFYDHLRTDAAIPQIKTKPARLVNRFLLWSSLGLGRSNLPFAPGSDPRFNVIPQYNDISDDGPRQFPVMARVLIVPLRSGPNIDGESM